MPLVKFGRNDEPGFELTESSDLIAVRTRSGRSVVSVGRVAAPASAEVGDGELVASFPDAGVEVYRVPATDRSLDDRKEGLRSKSDVRFAGSVLVRAGSEEPVLYTENIYIRFKEDLDEDDCMKIIREAGLTLKERLDFATNAFSVSAPEGTGQKVFEIALELLKRDDVIYCHPELIERRVSKQIYPQQWHLQAASVNGVSVNAHANVGAAHGLTRGAGVTIAIIDDGVDIDHPEFSSPGKIAAPRDATLKTSDPRPKRSRDSHGTACAGVACADGSDGASGVAPQARLMPIRLVNGLGSFQEAEAFRWAADNGADIISCSWGPPDGDWWDSNEDGGVHQLAASTRDAIDYAVTNGRGGKGCLILFAAGNGNESVDDDGYASYNKVVAVAACNDLGKRSVYSDFGSAIWCAFPSNDFGHAPFQHPNPLTRGIWTTDRLGGFGYNPGDPAFGDLAGNYNNDFGGTSSSCPGAAGVAALVLSTNQSLRWNEVKDILRQACDRIDPSAGKYSSDGHSLLYGYGRLNAETAVTLAKQSIGQMTIVNKLLNEPISDFGRIEAKIEIAEPMPVEKIAVSIRLEHTYIGDLVITVIPPHPGATPVILHDRVGGSRKNLDTVFDSSNTPALLAFAGKSCNGNWTIRVEDEASRDTGTLVQVGLQLFLPQVKPGAVADQKSLVSAASEVKASWQEEGSGPSPTPGTFAGTVRLTSANSHVSNFSDDAKAVTLLFDRMYAFASGSDLVANTVASFVLPLKDASSVTQARIIVRGYTETVNQGRTILALQGGGRLHEVNIEAPQSAGEHGDKVTDASRSVNAEAMLKLLKRQLALQDSGQDTSTGFDYEAELVWDIPVGGHLNLALVLGADQVGGDASHAALLWVDSIDVSLNNASPGCNQDHPVKGSPALVGV